jgi:hypothetical protein
MVRAQNATEGRNKTFVLAVKNLTTMIMLALNWTNTHSCFFYSAGSLKQHSIG